jgi:3-oxoacyl-[acyl-carrier-protein] synthase-3
VGAETPGPSVGVAGAAVIGWGASLPAVLLTTADLATSFGTTSEWIVQRTGIHERHVGGTTSGLASEAGRQALERADVDPKTVDALILATTTPERDVPATAAAVQHSLGLRCGAMDLNAACSGFVYALTMAYGLIAIGARRLLVIGSDVMTRLTDPHDRDTAILFGDGAGAIVIEASDRGSRLLGWDMDSDGSAADLLYADHGGWMKMNGREVFKQAVKMMVSSVERAVAAANVTVDDISLMVPHQANVRIIQAIADRLDLPAGRTAIVVHRTGNTSSASVPIALADALDAGRIRRGDLVLFAGFGAGMSAASAVVRW